MAIPKRCVVVGLVLGAVGCGRFEAAAPTPVFAIAGAHEQLACEACHGPAPFGPLDPTCTTCHEEDRKNPQHYTGITCNGADGVGCHTAADNSWSDIAPLVDHDFLPLEGAHALACDRCHELPEGGPDLNGQAKYCYNCHEINAVGRAAAVGPFQARPDDGHWALEGDELNPLFRWDCQGCHETTGTMLSPFPINHPMRIPHGAIISDGPTCVVNPALPDTLLTDCASCHPNPNDFTTFDCFNCHGEAHVDGQGEQIYLLEECLGCHVSGGPDANGECDSIP